MTSSAARLQSDPLYVAAVSNPGAPDEDLRVRRLSVGNVRALSKSQNYSYLVISSQPVSHRLKLPVGYHFKKFSLDLGKVPSGRIAVHKHKTLLVQVGFVTPGVRKLRVRLCKVADLLRDVAEGHLATAFVADQKTPLDKARLETELASPAINSTNVSNRTGKGEDLESRNRERVLAAQRDMLNRVPALTSEQLAERLLSTTSNASQLGQDWRTSGRLFGVRFGKAWHYPEFQLETSGKPFPEVAEVLTALGENERGWAYLQWFLEPSYGLLEGATPLEVWNSAARKRVVEAARLADWRGRD